MNDLVTHLSMSVEILENKPKWTWELTLDDGHYGGFCAGLRYDEPFDRSNYIIWLKKLVEYAEKIESEGLERWPEDYVD